MRYTDDLIEEVRSRNDIVDIIGENVRLTRAGNSYKGLCPFHNERTPSFHVDRSKQMYYCFGCHAGGNIFTFLREYNNMSFTEAMQYLADRAGVTLPKEEYSAKDKENADRRARLMEVNKRAAGYFHYLLRRAAWDLLTLRKGSSRRRRSKSSASGSPAGPATASTGTLRTRAMRMTCFWSPDSSSLTRREEPTTFSSTGSCSRYRIRGAA